MELIKYYFIGLAILIIAILANFLATSLGLKTWYAFLEGWGNGNALKLKDGLWLFVFYPLILGFSVKLANFVWNILC